MSNAADESDPVVFHIERRILDPMLYSPFLLFSPLHKKQLEHRGHGGHRGKPWILRLRDLRALTVFKGCSFLSKATSSKIDFEHLHPAHLGDVGYGNPRHTAIEVEGYMTLAVNSAWETLSSQFAEIAEQSGKFIVSVHGGRRVAASGIVWRPEIVVTGSHMLRRTDDIEIAFGGESRHKATFLGRDPGTDIAVLRLEKGNSAAELLPDTSKLRVGQLVLAVGRSTLGDLAAAAGIIARLGAPWQTWRGGKIDTLLRPDVNLYPGQSGSALVDSRGRLLGMNTSALARVATITVPTATVERVVNEIVEHGGVFRPYLGLAMQAVSLPTDLSSKLKIDQNSALMVMQVEPESPTAEAGITLGDLIVSINSQPVSGIEDVQRTLSKAKRGDSVDLGYVRGGQLASLKVKLADRPRH